MSSSDSKPPGVLNIGCGNTIIPNAINLDVVDYGQEIIHDITQAPLPFSDNSFNTIICHHILEHLPDFHRTVTDIHRVAKPQARIHVKAPFFLSTKYFGEPDHKVPFSIRTFDNYECLEERRLRWYEQWKLNHRTNYNSHVRFKVCDKRFNMSRFIPLRWFNPLINIEPVVFERLFSSILPPEEVIFILEVVKNAAVTN